MIPLDKFLACGDVEDMSQVIEKPYSKLNRLGLIGLYRLGLFDPITCEYEGTYFQRAWESKEVPPLFIDLEVQP